MRTKPLLEVVKDLFDVEVPDPDASIGRLTLDCLDGTELGGKESCGKEFCGMGFGNASDRRFGRRQALQGLSIDELAPKADRERQKSKLFSPQH